LAALLGQMGLDQATLSCEPAEVRELVDGTIFEIAGMRIEALHAPGHTPGSTVFIVNEEHLISGDVLFAGSIGRTDLLLGDSEVMRKSLRKVILPMDDALIVHPGHGAETTIGRERKQNQYLQENFLKGV
jgi:glyoxylase-like metal-dependent hydrolase (beta-lactamase superfamily II)